MAGFEGAGSIAAYTTLEKIGEGTFGQVFRAKLKRTGKVFALKKVRLKRVEDGIAPATLRELKALQHIEHENVVRLVDTFPHGSNVVLVLEYVQSDLARLLEHSPTRLCESDIKCLSLMLLHGIAACHERHVIHRVRKPSRAPTLALFAPSVRASCPRAKLLARASRARFHASTSVRF
jgi:serine/threonine protein kinase